LWQSLHLKQNTHHKDLPDGGAVVIEVPGGVVVFEVSGEVVVTDIPGEVIAVVAGEVGIEVVTVYTKSF